MYKLPWMKFWLRVWKADTMHLTFAQRGAYLALLTEAWDTPTCSLPADPAWLQRRLCATDDEYSESVQPVIDEFWTLEDHRIFQNRQRKEWKSAIERADAGKLAANVRWSGRKVIPLKIKDSI